MPPLPPVPLCSIYLVTPLLRRNDAAAFARTFADVLAAAPVASALARFAPGAEADAKAIAAPLIAAASARDCALLLEGNARLAARLGADGVHVEGAGEALEEALESLKPERIVGAGALASRDEAMTAGDMGADYVMFGEPFGDGGTPPLPALVERVGWWAEIFETPCVAFAEFGGSRRIARPRRGRFRRARRRDLAGAVAGRRPPPHRGPAQAGPGGKVGGGGTMRRMALAALALAAAAGAAFAQETSAPAPGAAPGLPFGGLGELAQPQQTPLPPRADGKPPDLAFGAYQRGNFLYALREAERRLDDNPKDAAAMALIGSIYRDGAAVGRNDLEASRWYRLASNLGNAGAAYELGVLLLQGAPNLPKDQAAAKAQFERAAAKDHAGALYNLGVMALDSSNGHKPDFEAAAEYFKRAALAGDDNGAYSYGVMLREGKGVQRNATEGAHWLKRASDFGVIAGQVEYAIILFNGDGIPKNEAEAVQVLRTAAIRGNPIAQNRLAHLYVVGRDVPRDLARAAAWNALAKGAGLADADLDASTMNLTEDERKRFIAMMRTQSGF